MYQLLPLVVVLASHLSQGSGEQCCKQKYVGEHLYNYVDSDPATTSPLGCHTDCVYSRVGESDSRYCFKPGDLNPLCPASLNPRHHFYGLISNLDSHLRDLLTDEQKANVTTIPRCTPPPCPPPCYCLGPRCMCPDDDQVEAVDVTDNINSIEEMFNILNPHQRKSFIDRSGCSTLIADCDRCFGKILKALAQCFEYDDPTACLKLIHEAIEDCTHKCICDIITLIEKHHPVLKWFLDHLGVKCKEDQEIRPKHYCDRECYDSKPFTCEFNFTMRTQFTDAAGRRADGRLRSVLTYNDVLPGPPIVICEGDKLVVNFKNDITGNLTTEDGSTNTTTLHFHGIREINRPYSDGVPFVTQCPLQPGEEFPGGYGFDTDINGAPAGTYWYHSHVGAQRTNGAYGALIIKENATVPNKFFDVDDAKNTLVLQEWYKSATNQTPVSILINGNGRVGEGILEGSDDEIKNHLYGKGGEFQCVTNTEYSSDNFPTNYTEFSIEDPGKRYRFRVIGAISQNVPLQLSIEDHNFTAIATDTLNIEPVENLTYVWLAAGERYDIVVHTKENYRPGEAYKIKIFGYVNPYGKKGKKGPLCSIAWLKYPNQTIDYGYVTPCNCTGFEHSSKDNRTLNPVPRNFTEWNDRLKFHDWKNLERTGSIFIADLRARKQASTIDVDGHATLNTQYIEFAGNITFNNLRMKYPKVPFLLQDPQQNANRCGTTCEARNLYTPWDSSTCTEMRPDICTEPTLKHQPYCACEHVIQQPWAPGYWVEIVLINNNAFRTAAHPIHQHGGWYHVVGEKIYNHAISRTYIMGLDRNCTAKKNCLPRNLDKPPAKDTIQVPPNGYVILRTPLDNAGTWIFHCHINFHVDIGMALVLQIGDQSKPWYEGQNWCTGPLPRNKPCLTQPPKPDGGPSFIKWFLGMEHNQTRCIQPGNDLVFSWTALDHNVNKLNTTEQYNKCTYYNDTPERGDIIWTAPALPPGTDSETHYFACGRGQGYHCKHGMKLKVFVKNTCP